MRLQFLSAANIKILLDIFSSITSHAHELNAEIILQKKLQKVCSILELSDPPMVHFENESYQNYLYFLRDCVTKNPLASQELNIELLLVEVCKKILQIYLECTRGQQKEKAGVKHRERVVRWILPLGSAKKEELGARTSLVVSALRVLSGMEREAFRKYVSNVFPLLVDLVRSEHSSREVQLVLGNMFHSCIGPIIMH